MDHATKPLMICISDSDHVKLHRVSTTFTKSMSYHKQLMPCLEICVSIYLSIRPPIYHLSYIYLSVHPSIHLSSVYLPNLFWRRGLFYSLLSTELRRYLRHHHPEEVADSCSALPWFFIKVKADDGHVVTLGRVLSETNQIMALVVTN